MKKGLSFTLTLVVVGVILLMTALSVITLGGSSLNQFFETFSGERDQAIEQNQIREACIEKMERIDREYCGNYIKTADYRDYNPPTNDYRDTLISGDAYSDYMNHSNDEWQEDIDCGDHQTTQNPRGFDAADNDEFAYDRTASEEGCSWVEAYDTDPTVTVQGQTFDCIQEGVVSNARCPAQ